MQLLQRMFLNKVKSIFLCLCSFKYIMLWLCICYSVYYKIFQKSYGAPTGEQMILDLKRHITEYNTSIGQTCAAMTTSNNDLVVAVCTPLMKRVHATIRQSSELVFVDSSGGVDRFNCRVFLFMTHSCAGGLPLGCIITTSDSREIISCGIELWKTILPDNCFYGRGTQGPYVFLTDDCCPLRQAIHSSFPESVLLLCIFHILQAIPYGKNLYGHIYVWHTCQHVCEKYRHMYVMLRHFIYETYHILYKYIYVAYNAKCMCPYM